MSLPPGFLEELRDRVSIAQVAGRKVSWDQRKSNPGKGDYWAPCPFHQEKTASFHVDDGKGYYYCFGCHAKGDALSFVRETENVGFMEAVEILAAEAGMQMPAPDPRAKARDDSRNRLVEVMEAAVRHGRLQLQTGAAAEARAYLDRRGLDAAALERFEIGFAPDSRTAMTEALKTKGFTEAEIVEAGLAIKPDDGGKAFDRFRGRILFPIRDARGRAIAFGGRAMDPNARAKYLNSPETPLFDKGRALYNLGPAREAAGKSGKLVVAEGYMDVIALCRHGFDHAVAPLGTAVTEDQLKLMWRIADEPVIALDGDAAGVRAAMRLIDVALPLLEPGKGLRFCLLPERMDPDEFLKAQGAVAMARLLDAAEPMVSLLWRRETEGQVFDSPERRAALDQRLRTLLARIGDASLRDHYRAALKDLRQSLFSPARPQSARGRPWRPGGRFPQAPAMPLPTTRASLLATVGEDDDRAAARVRESAILLGCLDHPQVARMLESELETTSFLCPDLESLRRSLLQALAETLHDAPDPEFRAMVASRIGGDLRDSLQGAAQIHLNPQLRTTADPETALRVLQDVFKVHRAIIGARLEVREAEEEIGGVTDEGLTWRLSEATKSVETATRAPEAAGAETDGIVMPNGATVSRPEQSELDKALSESRRISEQKSGRR